MTSYLLLRNNKESGPYTLNELVGNGLKPYDLVWINGKSAAWRYPSEVPELSQYAPAVEEQPFDRFYKKNVEEKSIDDNNTTQKQIQPKEEKPAIEEISTQPAFVPKRSVFVTMPGKQSLSAEASAKAVGSQQPAVGSRQSSNKVEQQQSYDQYQQYQPQVNSNDASHLTQTITIKENPVAAEIKYSQSLDDIKEMYVRTLQQRKQRIVNKAMLLKLAKNAAIILAIAGVGAIIGFSVKGNKSGKNDIVNATSVQPAIMNPSVAEIPDSTASKLLLQQEVSATPVDNEIRTQIEKNEQEQIFPEQEKPIPPVVPQHKTNDEPVQKDEPIAKTMIKKEPGQKREPIISPTYPGTDVNARGERTRTVREGTDVSAYNGNEEIEKETPTTPAPKEQPKAIMKSSTSGSLSKQVSVSSNDYQVVAFGGIRNLHLTVTNNSKYVLDNVIVELNYLKPSEQPLKTQNIEFRGVSPNGTMTIKVPDTNRGVKISYRILNVLSVQSQKESAGL